MKLWLKISLVVFILLIISTSACTLFILISSGQSSIELEINNILETQNVRISSWITVMQSSVNDIDNDTAQRSLARYMIERVADSNTILISEDDIIFNSTVINPEKYLPINDIGQFYTIQDIDDKTFLIAGSNTNLNNTPYSLYVIKDISSIYNAIGEMSYRFAIINFTVILIAEIITMLLIKLVLRPVAVLKQNTASISNGIYDKRIVLDNNDEISELADDFNKMAEAVSRHVEQLKDEVERRTMFMAALTHELKTPITSISGFAQTLLQTKTDEEEHDEMLVSINNECMRIERLSQKLIQIIRLQNDGNIKLSLHKVSDLLEAVRLSCKEQLNLRGLTLYIDNSMDMLMMDMDLMQSLLINLIDNAGKASKPGDKVVLKAKDSIISVSDNGKGIKQDEICNLTQPFYMVDKSRSSQNGSMGLGLTLAAEIARVHGAYLTFDSIPGKGTTVKVVFENV